MANEWVRVTYWSDGTVATYPPSITSGSAALQNAPIVLWCSICSSPMFGHQDTCLQPYCGGTPRGAH